MHFYKEIYVNRSGVWRWLVISWCLADLREERVKICEESVGWEVEGLSPWPWLGGRLCSSPDPWCTGLFVSSGLWRLSLPGEVPVMRGVKKKWIFTTCCARQVIMRLHLVWSLIFPISSNAFLVRSCHLVGPLRYFLLASSSSFFFFPWNCLISLKTEHVITNI